MQTFVNAQRYLTNEMLKHEIKFYHKKCNSSIKLYGLALSIWP